MNRMCCACLSSNRNLAVIPDEHWKLLLDVVVPMTSKNHQNNFILLRKVLKTCWECHSRLQGIVRFRRTALVGLEYMTQFYSLDACPNALSSLSVSNIKITSFNDTGPLDFKVEDEIEVPIMSIKQDIGQDMYSLPVVSDPLNEELNIKSESDNSNDDANIGSMLSSSVICKIENALKSGENDQDNRKLDDLMKSNKMGTSQISEIKTPSTNNETIDEIYQTPLYQTNETNNYSFKKHDKQLKNPPKIELKPVNTTNEHMLPKQMNKTVRIAPKLLIPLIPVSKSVAIAPKLQIPVNESVAIAPKLQIPVNESVANEPDVLLQVNKSVAEKPTLLKFLLDNVRSLPKAPNFMNNISVKSIPNTLQYIPSSADRRHDNIVPFKNVKWNRMMYSEAQVIEQLNKKRSNIEFRESKYKCVDCVLVFENDNALKEHLEDLHDEKNCKYVCPICKQRFRAIDYLLKIHMREHCDKFVCVSCKYEAPSEGFVKMHKCNSISNVQKLHKCNSISNVQSLTGNISFYRRGTRKKREYKCSECDATFKNSKDKYNHFVSIHKPKQKVQCNMCDQILGNKFSLQNHIKRKHECNDTIDNMAYYCKPCGLRFNNKYSYENHLKTSLKHLSAEDLKFVCEQCDRRFLRKQLLLTHIDRIHLKIKGAFECDKCSKAFHFKRRLIEHIRIKHDKIPLPRTYICEVCAEGFTTSGILKHHMYRHTGERPYKCKKCPSTFSQSGALFMHNKLVHEKVKVVWKKKTGKKKKVDVKEKLSRKKMREKE